MAAEGRSYQTILSRCVFRNEDECEWPGYLD